MGKMNRKPVVKEDSESDHSENISDEQYDSMIENGTSEDSEEDDNSESEEESSSEEDEQSEDENKISHSTPNGISKKRKNTDEPIVELKKVKTAKNDNKLLKPPTAEEINQLRETENLYHSNLFRMQIREMLREVQVKARYKTYLTTWLEKLNAFLTTLKPMSKKEDSTNISFLKNSRVKLPIDVSKLAIKKFQFQFSPPSEQAYMVGSADVDTWIGPKLSADICIPMPSGGFQKDDYLNLIYDQKRALYLAYIANEMLKHNFYSSNLKFNYTNNNVYKPVLEIVPKEKIGEKLTIRLYVVGDDESFKLNRYVPWNSNIRGSLFGKKMTDDKDEIPLATPNYNATVLYDLTMKANQKVIAEILGPHKNLRDGLVLLKIWLRQRQLNVGFFGFGNYLMTMVVVYLFKERKIHASMSSYQVARNVWNHLASSSWHIPDKGISLCSTHGQPNQPTIEQFHTYYDIVFVDSTGYFNLCANLSLDVYLAIKYESGRALDLLNNTKVNSFQALFMTKISAHTRFDHFLKIKNQEVIENAVNQVEKKSEIVNFAGMWYPQIIKMISSVLRKGLGERVLYFIPVEDECMPWSIGQTATKKLKTVKYGFTLNIEYAFEILDKGPQANDPASEEFRQFWGEKTQLRRFQDGSITESCVWSSATAPLSEKRLVVKEIVEYLLSYHFKIMRKDFQYFGGNFDLAYRLDKTMFVFEMIKDDAENTTFNVIQKFDNIAKKLRSCDDLPLEITSVQGISSVFRYCDPIPALNNATYYEENGKKIFQSYKLCHGVIQLGLSGKWPSDLPAFRRIKAAFHIQIARSLREKFKLITHGDMDGIRILNDGYLYKLEIFHPKEVALMKKTLSIKGVVQYVDTPASLDLEKRLDVLPKITSALHGLYQQYTSFGPTVMIAKRWLYSQLLDTFLWPDECTELLVASQFLKDGCCPNPVQPQAGFFRFLEMLANFNFSNEMIMLNFNDELSHDELADLDTKFSTDRSAYPPLAIITSFDSNKDCMWTKSSPSPQLLGRVILLARQALQIVQNAYSIRVALPLDELFTASLDGYDLIIKLDRDLIRSCHVYQFDSESNRKMDATIPAAEFDPVKIGLQELRDSYSDFALFFYNPCGGKEIAVIWKPECFTTREFKVADINGCSVGEDGVVKCNVDQLIEDFKITLNGLFYVFVNNRINSNK